MNKNLLAVTIFPVDVNGLFADPFESAREIDIITDCSSYISTDEVKINVNFKNDLLTDIKIINDNCETPIFILEKKIEEVWDRVYLSDNFGLPVRAVSYTLLPGGQAFNAEIYIYTNEIQDEIIDGRYRLRFNLIDKESSNRLPEKYLYSNVFKIGDEYEL